ncbi:sigma-70 family RNA polymerase sigma factor [Actinoplanes sp. NPDC051861]|uniref:RNA polymerase sigma factor n=1 Tax=Actinoplanes sp. NPDC051861 TaxID=3155170 RepID=UPI00343B2028
MTNDQMAPTGAGPDTVPDSAWQDFFAANYHRLRVMGTALCGSPETAEDAVVEAMVEVRRRWSTIDDPFRYAYRVVVNRVRRSRVRQRAEFDRAVKGGHYTDGRYHDPGFVEIEDEEFVLQLLESLPDRQRAVMEGAYQGLGPGEIARELGRDPATVRKTLQHARERLVAELSRQQQQDAAADTAARKATR